MSEQPAVVINFPRPPSANRMFSRQVTRRGRSSEYKAWARAAGWLLRMQIVGLEPLHCRFNVVIEVPLTPRHGQSRKIASTSAKTGGHIERRECPRIT